MNAWVRQSWRITAGCIVALLLVATPAAALELTLWEQEREDIQSVLDTYLAEFTKQNPDIKIKRAHYKNEDLRTQFQTAAMGGGGADIVMAPNDFGGPFAIMGIIQPVDKWAQLDRFDATVVQAAQGLGQTWGVPVSKGNHLMLFVNKKLVPKAPATLEELVAEAKKVSDANADRFGFAYNLNEPFWFVTFLGAYGQRPLNDAKPQLGGAPMEQALGFVKDLKFKSKVVPQDCDYACAETLFMEGKAGMIINGDWAMAKYQGALGEQLEIAPLPKLAATGKHMAPMVSGKYLFFHRKLKGKRLEAAQKFANFMTSEATQRKMVADMRRLPALKSLAESDIVKKDAVLAASDAALAHGQPMPMDVEMRVVWDAIRPQLQAVMAGRAEPKAAAKIMQADAETKIKELRE